MRIASLLPSATEIVCAVGAGHQLVARSHECDFPESLVRDVPVVTGSQYLGGDSAAIDASVRDAMDRALAIYHVDYDALRAARPDIVITQDLCEVCAVPASAVERAVCNVLSPGVSLVRLAPRTLNDVLADVIRVGELVDRRDSAHAAVDAMTSRLDALRNETASIATRPSVLTIEWLDPLMVGGLWTPELVTLAGGVALEASPGELARTIDAGAISVLDPDVVVFKPCGFKLQMSEAELRRIDTLTPKGLRCRDGGRVFVTDGNAYFNRSGPRLVDSAELLAGLLFPNKFDAFVKQFANVVRRVGDDGFVPVG